MTAVQQRLGRRALRIESVALQMSGLSMCFVGGGLLLCAVVDVAKGGDALLALLASAALSLSLGGLAWRFSCVGDDIAPKQVFMAVTCSWLSASVAGALPFIFSGLVSGFHDALFESISGFTCTGSTILNEAQFESGSAGVMFWRQLSQWFGGMGMIVLAVAVLPFLGVGGLDLIKAEAPGETSDRLAPRVRETAKRLWLVYLLFTGVSIVALLGAGLDWFNAAGLAAALVSTGGFAPEATSIGAYDSVLVEVILIIGMIIGGASFTLHYRALRGEVSVYHRNSEFRAYLLAIVVGVVVVTAALLNGSSAFGEALRFGAFNVVTLATSCGFGNATGSGTIGDFVFWAPVAQITLFLFMWVGGMTGSTSGGSKVLRAQVMGRVAAREVLRARHPRAVIPIHEGRDPVEEKVVSRIGGFLLLYFLIVLAATLIITMFGTDILTALSGTTSAMGNMGPALGEAGPTSNFLVFSAPERMILALLMLVGRLEVFPLVLSLVVLGGRLRRRRQRLFRTAAQAISAGS